MDSHQLERIAAVISWVEGRLHEKLDLDTAADAAGYSKFHLHRMFADATGMTLHSYIRRRRLTEAARQLVCSRQPIIEIALAAGYESQQSFAAAFKDMYKRTPLEYRRNRRFYPLQLAFAPQKNFSRPSAGEISYASPADIPAWMGFLGPVIGGFPCLEEGAHLEQVRGYVRRGEALLLREGAAVLGAAAFSAQAGSIDFLAVHPQYRRSGAAEALLDFMVRNRFPGRAVSITTFRAGDRADMGQREEYLRLGFGESELLTEFGYPTQRLVLPPGKGGVRDE